MTAIFRPEGPLFRATGARRRALVAGDAAGQRDHGADDARGRAAAPMHPALPVRRLTFDLWRPAGLRAFSLATDMLRDGRKAKTMQVRLIGRRRRDRPLHGAVDRARRASRPLIRFRSKQAMTPHRRQVRRRRPSRKSGAAISRTCPCD